MSSVCGITPSRSHQTAPLTLLPGFPDPFAVATISGEQTKTTGVIKKTLNPYWNESFDMSVFPTSHPSPASSNHSPRRVTEESILAVQIFDQKKFKKKDQGFLGVVNVRVGSVLDLDAGGDGEHRTSTSYSSHGC